MKINQATALKKQVKALQKATEVESDKIYVTKEGTTVTVAKDTRFNVTTNKAGSVIPLMWDAATGTFKAVFTKGTNTKSISDTDIQEASEAFGKATSGNILLNSDGSKIDSNNTVVVNSPGTILGQECDSTAVINSPGAKLHECEFGVLKDCPGFFGWLSHWINAEGSKNGQILNSDQVDMIRSPGAHVDSCEYLKMKDSEGAHYRQSSSSHIEMSPDSVGYEVNQAHIVGSAGLAAAYSYRLNINNSGGNGIIHSPLSKMDDSPFERKTPSLGQQVNAQYEKAAKDIRLKKGNFHKFSEARDRALKTALESALKKNGNISKSPGSTITRSKNVTSKDSNSPTISNSPGAVNDTADKGLIENSPGALAKDCSGFVIKNSERAQVIDSTGAEAIDSPGVILDTSMGRIATNEPNVRYVNKPVNSAGQKTTYQKLLAEALAS